MLQKSPVHQEIWHKGVRPDAPPERTIRWFVWLLILLAVTACRATLRPGAGQAELTATPTGETAVLPMPSFTALPTPTPTFKPGDVHQAEGAGRWYPADPAKLQAAVDAYVSQAGVDPLPGRLLAVIVPHAGYTYSGAVAGYSFRALQEACGADHIGSTGPVKVLAVIGDTHTGNGSAEIFAGDESVFTFSMHQGDIYPIPKAKSDLDVLMVMAKQLDQASVDSATAVHILPMKSADAVSVANMVSRLYRESQNAARRAGIFCDLLVAMR